MASTRSSSGAARLAGILLLATGACATSADNGAAPQLAPAARPAAPKTEDGLSMRAERGSIDRDEAEEAIIRHWSELKGCYAEAGAATGFAGGSVTLHFEVAVDGHATAVNVQASQLGNLAVERCLIAAGLAVRFSRPHGNGRASLEYSMEFRSTGERKVVDLPEESVAGLRAAVLARVGGDCGSVGPGALTCTFYVDRRGQVQSVGLGAKAAIAPDKAACVATALQRLPLPSAGGLGPAGDSLGRISIAFDNGDLAAALTAPAPPVAVRQRRQDRPDRADRERLAAQGRRRHR